MRNFCLFLAILLFAWPVSGQADVLDYFEDANYEFCTYERPAEDLDSVSNGLFWEVRAGAEDGRRVFERLGEVKAVTVTVHDFDKERFFRDFRVTVLSVQELPDVTIYYALSGNRSAAGTGNMQIALRKDGMTKIGVPALLNSY